MQALEAELQGLDHELSISRSQRDWSASQSEDGSYSQQQHHDGLENEAPAFGAIQASTSQAASEESQINRRPSSVPHSASSRAAASDEDAYARRSEGSDLELETPGQQHAAQTSLSPSKGLHEQVCVQRFS